MIFFPKITETNSRTLDLPLPNQDIQPTKPQQSQPLVTHHKIARRAHKARALRGSITSCHPQNTKQSRKVVELPRAQESTDKLPTALRRLVNTRREHAPSHRPTSSTARNGVGAFLRPPPPEPENRPSSLTPPRPEVGGPSRRSHPERTRRPAVGTERSHGLQPLRSAASRQLSGCLHTLFTAPGNHTGDTGSDVRAGGLENTQNGDSKLP